MVELRRYTLHPGRLPELLAVFERHLIETQEEAGMTVAGTFADEDNPDTFTWLRGFADHDARVRALAAFYDGPIWARHADAANATMIDSDDVLLLRPTRVARPPAPAVARGRVGDLPRRERVLLGTYGLPDDPDPVEDWLAAVVPALETALGARVAAWQTDPHPNGFPRLPVRSDRALAWLAVLPDQSARDAALSSLRIADVSEELERRTRWHRISRLTPTPRSAHPAAEPPMLARPTPTPR